MDAEVDQRLDQRSCRRVSEIDNGQARCMPSSAGASPAFAVQCLLMRQRFIVRSDEHAFVDLDEHLFHHATSDFGL
jgi:hypothetical protein